MRYRIEWSGDLFGVTTIEASCREEAVTKLKEMAAKTALHDLPDTEFNSSDELEIEDVTEEEEADLDRSCKEPEKENLPHRCLSCGEQLTEHEMAPCPVDDGWLCDRCMKEND